MKNIKVVPILKETKTWVWLGVALVALYILGRLTGVFKSKEKKEEQKKETQTTDSANQVIKDEAKKGIVLTYPLFQYNSMADKIYNALRHSWFDDKPDIAESVLMRMKNNADISQLYLSYGKRQLYAFGLPVGSPKDLTSTIADQLSSNSIKRINNYYAANRIDFRF
jgi:hypothetical protein